MLGNTEQIERVYEDTPFEVLVITTELSDESLKRVKAFAAAHHVKLGVFVAETHYCGPDDLDDELKKLAPQKATQTSAEPSAD